MPEAFVPESVLAFQARLMDVVVLLGEAKPVGTLGGVVSGGGGEGLLTVRLMVELVVVLPAASRAMAVSVWEPFKMVVVSQVME
jgi:hypothetical protein